MLNILLQQNDHSFAPNETIEGKIDWHDIESDSTSIEIRLLWHTQGKGTLDMEVVSAISVPTPAVSGSHTFRFDAPHRPLSFSGKLVSLVWSIEAIVFPSQETERIDLVVSNRGSEIILHSDTGESESELVE
jgi:hypothetical protein